MPAKVEVKGARELQEQMRRFEENFRTKEVVGGMYKAGQKCMMAGAQITKRTGSGGRYRQVVKKMQKRTFAQTTFKSERTSTYREANEFVVIRRQNKPPVFVPIRSNPHKTTTNRNAYNAERNRPVTDHVKAGWGIRTGKHSAYGDARRGDRFLDNPAEIKKIRTIRRRGFASQSFRVLAAKVGATGKARVMKPPKSFWLQQKMENINRFVRFRAHMASNRPSLHYQQLSKYIPKVYAGIESRIVSVAAHNLRGEIDARLARRAAKLNKPRGRTA